MILKDKYVKNVEDNMIKTEKNAKNDDFLKYDYSLRINNKIINQIFIWVNMTGIAITRITQTNSIIKQHIFYFIYLMYFTRLLMILFSFF
jgi:hypothetical protein